MKNEEPVTATPAPLKSECVIFPSRSGKTLIGFLDYAGETIPDRPFVLVTPKYGESKKNNLQLAYYLAANGLNVLRFDQSCHVGESEGEIKDYTYSGAVLDIQGAMDFLENAHGVRSLILAANSLSVRCALRVAAKDPRVERFVSMVGVVNFQSTAKVVYQRDMVDEYLDGRLHGISDILGHQVDVDHFLEDCVEGNFHNLQGTLEDVERASCALFFFNAERDVWVDFAEVQQLADANPRVTVSNLRGAMHEVRESPEAMREALLHLVFTCRHGRLAQAGEEETLVIPAKEVIIRQNKLERDRLKAAAPLRESERDFWKNYLHKYNILEEVTDYQQYLQLIGSHLGPIEGGRVYFDCGCGTGLFGAWCLRDLMRGKTFAEWPPVYFGLDLTDKGLGDAMRKHLELSRVTGETGPEGLDLMYLRFDLDELDPEEGGLRLPIGDQAVDRICCSLLISYLKRPHLLLKELHRVLRPGGRIAVSSMKPYCDLSLIYKDTVEESPNEQMLVSARDLLSAAGAIKLKEEEGHYVFYGRGDLLEVVGAAGFKRGRVFRSFGDQANVVLAEK